jgi:hypothetical protein
MLTPLPPKPRPRDKQVLAAVGNKVISTPKDGEETEGATEYRIVPTVLNETAFFNFARDKGRLVLVLNPEHPFYKLVYRPLLESENPRDETMRSQIDLLLLAAARSEALLEDENAMNLAEQLRNDWSDTLATYLND